MKKAIFLLTISDFADLFGTKEEFIYPACRDLISNSDFRYKILDCDKRDGVLLDIIKKIDSGTLSEAGKWKKDIWEKGWAENLHNFTQKNYEIDELTPKYYRPGQILRIKRDYAIPINPDFEFNFFKVLRLWLFQEYFSNTDSIYEFGCGPGHNLVALAALYPAKKIYGLDWSEAAVELVNKIAGMHSYNIVGHFFDMFTPDEDYKIADNSAILTIGSLEQLGEDYEAFLRYILNESPGLCVNVEPFTDLYDENNLLDYLAIRYQAKRKYLAGYLNRLMELEKKGEIEILKIQRMLFGNMYYNGWSYVAWRPRKQTWSEL